MTPQKIQEAQDFLTVADGYGERKIMDVLGLFRTYDPCRLIMFLKSMYQEKEEQLIALMLANKTSFELDKTIACLFRIQMAIRKIEKHLQEVQNAHT